MERVEIERARFCDCSVLWCGLNGIGPSAALIHLGCHCVHRGQHTLRARRPNERVVVDAAPQDNKMRSHSLHYLSGGESHLRIKFATSCCSSLGRTLTARIDSRMRLLFFSRVRFALFDPLFRAAWLSSGGSLQFFSTRRSYARERETPPEKNERDVDSK